MRRAFLICLAALAVPAFAAPPPDWRLTRSEHFEVYAQIPDRQALAILTWLEQLRAFFDPQGTLATASPPVRVIVFASEQEYQPYRLRPTSDAYYVGAPSQDYIVMGSDDPAKFGRAAHEYAHLALRAAGLKLPPWLTEGLAEFYATLHVGQRVELGGAIPGRVRVLRTGRWMPLAELVTVPEDRREQEERAQAEMFYSESWALAQMLATSPVYAAGFRKLVARLEGGDASILAFTAVYGKTPEAIERDLHRWVDQASQPLVDLPELRPAAPRVQVSAVTPLESRVLLAKLLLAAGEYDRAEPRFTALAREAPRIPEVFVALGTIALHRGNSAAARNDWKRAIDLGIADAQLCYRYAILADEAGLSAEEIRPPLERAIALRPEFDDAHYQLALLEKNAGHYEAALQELHALRTVTDARAYAYWLALADTYNELGRREDAQTAARHAIEHSASSDERARAQRQIYTAQTDPSVRFSRDAAGQLQLVTTRVPHGQSDSNPFIEPSDDMHRVQGMLRDIDCGDVTTVRIEQAGKLLKLTIPDLRHVQMTHAPAEFVCGSQTPASVTVDYARTPNSSSDGIVRGMEFMSSSAR